MSTIRSSAPPGRPTADDTIRRGRYRHRLGAGATVVLLTVASIALPNATGPLRAAEALDASSATPVAPTVPPADPNVPSRLLRQDELVRGSNRIEVDWGDVTPLQGQPAAIQGTVPVPRDGGSRWVYLEEWNFEDGVWGYLKDTRSNAAGQFQLDVTLDRINEPRRFRISVDKALGVPALASASATFKAVWQPVGPTTKNYPGITVVWPGAQMLVGSAQSVRGTLTARLTKPTATLQRQVAGQWADLGRAAVNVSGEFVVPLPTPYLGTGAYRLQVTDSRGGVVETPAEQLAVIPTYTPAGRATSYSLVSSSPVGRWNPCAPIGYRVNLVKAPPGALVDVQAALAQVSQATGLQFTYRGTTTVVPFAAGNTFDPAVADLVIAWADPAQLRGLLPSGTLGVGGPEFRSSLAVDPTGRSVRQIYQGGVTINSAFNKALKPGSGEGLTRVAALMHEIGHAVGLMHVEGDDAQLMSPSIGYGLDQWGAGDLAGLQAVGADGGCLTPSS